MFSGLLFLIPLGSIYHYLFFIATAIIDIPLIVDAE